MSALVVKSVKIYDENRGHKGELKDTFEGADPVAQALASSDYDSGQLSEAIRKARQLAERECRVGEPVSISLMTDDDGVNEDPHLGVDVEFEMTPDTAV